MHRTQLLLPRELHRRAQPSPEAIDEVLFSEPFDDPHPDPQLSTNVDHYLYGAARRPGRRR